MGGLMIGLFGSRYPFAAGLERLFVLPLVGKLMVHDMESKREIRGLAIGFVGVVDVDSD